VRADGGTVDPDAEAAKLAANALEHQAAVQVAATRNAILNIAMGAR
jgi:flagellar basal body rod protein FlgB